MFETSLGYMQPCLKKGGGRKRKRGQVAHPLSLRSTGLLFLPNIMTILVRGCGWYTNVFLPEVPRMSEPRNQKLFLLLFTQATCIPALTSQHGGPAQNDSQGEHSSQPQPELQVHVMDTAWILLQLPHAAS